MRKRVLVTGGAGFIGSHLCERLIADGHTVICVDNLFTGSRDNLHSLLAHPRFEFVHHDITVPLNCEVDEIYHLACPASPVHYQRDPVLTIRTGVLGTMNMLDVARDAHARILIASTSEVYGDPEIHPQVESYWGNVNPIGARACYNESKRCAESLAVCYARQFGVQVRIPRIFNTYGPRLASSDGRVISNFISQGLRGEPITIYGDGSQTRSFCYVTDLIEGLVGLMGADCQALPMNLGNPEEFTIRELAQKVCEYTGSTAGLVFHELPQDDPRQRRPDISRAREQLRWEPTVPLAVGLRRTIEHMRRTARD